MALIDEAIAGLESRDPGEKFALKEVTKKWGVNRSTLGRRWRRVTEPRSDKYAQQQAIGPQQQLELVQYINKLPKQGLRHTREMIRDFSSEVAHQQLSESWVTRFINRHQIHLISKWTTAMDLGWRVGSPHRLSQQTFVFGDTALPKRSNSDKSETAMKRKGEDALTAIPSSSTTLPPTTLPVASTHTTKATARRASATSHSGSAQVKLDYSNFGRSTGALWHL
ncbi:hypothetical protein DDE82_009162 [Stemphylium lycopersici]|uniref:HTH CENPB-type domain-containing protein n=1 Tax=Stemphylium lycopersici TaxID=183478 RepID=A0A364MRM1_STELY|nr:hypothetical protein TW65_07437 [Stemphylium lycopersici]RAQ93888.1 hypothetical protein DDE82_009162 [Stemphylium lycopersici]RAQ99135.1 hypothetical protein DDE83_009207 [Stemphylium lycopersici]